VEAVVMVVKRCRYTGELLKPIVLPDAPSFSGAVTNKRVEQFWQHWEKHQRKTERRVAQTLNRKLSLLMKHYGINDKTDTASLALALACEHVPGFEIVPRRKRASGRKREWDSEKLQALYDVVQSVKQKHNFNDRTALKFISTNSELASTWGRPANHRGSQKQWVETLESRLQAAKRWVSHTESVMAEFEKIRTDLRQKKFRKS
jgi:hypothetical protein